VSGPDPEAVAQRRRRRSGERVEDCVVAADLGVEVLPAPGQGPQSVLGRGAGGVDVAGPVAGAAVDERFVGEPIERFAQFSGGVHHDASG